MTTQSLPELEEELDLIISYLDSEIPEDRKIAENLLNELLPQLESKIDGYIKAIKWKESLIDCQLKEAQRCQQLAKANQNTVDWLKNKLLKFMEQRVDKLGDKGKKLEGKLCKISFHSNGGRPPIWINETLRETDFPQEYVEMRPYVNRQKLTEDAIDYGEVRDGNGNLIAAVMPRGKHLRIK